MARTSTLGLCGFAITGRDFSQKQPRVPGLYSFVVPFYLSNKLEAVSLVESPSIFVTDLDMQVYLGDARLL